MRFSRGRQLLESHLSSARQNWHAIQIEGLTKDILIQIVHTGGEDECGWFQCWEKIIVGQYAIFTERCRSLSS